MIKKCFPLLAAMAMTTVACKNDTERAANETVKDTVVVEHHNHPPPPPPPPVAPPEPETSIELGPDGLSVDSKKTKVEIKNKKASVEVD